MRGTIVVRVSVGERRVSTWKRTQTSIAFFISSTYGTTRRAPKPKRAHVASRTNVLIAVGVVGVVAAEALEPAYFFPPRLFFFPALFLSQGSLPQ